MKMSTWGGIEKVSNSMQLEPISLILPVVLDVLPRLRNLVTSQLSEWEFRAGHVFFCQPSLSPKLPPSYFIFLDIASPFFVTSLLRLQVRQRLTVTSTAWTRVASLVSR